MRFGRAIGAIALAAIAIAAGACSGDEATSETGAASPAPTPSETESPATDSAGSTDSTGEAVEPAPVATDVGALLESEPGSPLPLDVGAYQVATFSPSFAFTLADLAVVNGALPVELDLTLGPNQDVRLTFLGDAVAPLRPKAKQTSTDLRLDEVPATAEALVSWLQAHPRLTASEPRSITVGGVEGTEVDVELKEGQGYRSDLCPAAQPCAALFHTGPDAPGRFGYVAEPGRKLRVAVLEVGGRRLVVVTQAAGSLEKLAKYADEVLSTVTFGA